MSYNPPPGSGSHQDPSHFASNNPFQQTQEEQNAWQAQQPSSTHYAPPPGPPPNQQSQYEAPSRYEAPSQSSYQYHQQQSNDESEQPWGNEPSNYSPPPRPPPGHQQSQQPSSYSQPQQQQYQPHPQAPASGLPRRASFEETAFVAPDERGEQREAFEQFELSHAGREAKEDRDVATLQSEFPSLDGSLIAALYGDSKSLSGTREMLREIGGSS